jgi:hypothetical protein
MLAAFDPLYAFSATRRMGHEIQWKTGGVVRRFFGHVTGNELLAVVVEIQADERFDSLRYVINDYRDVTGFTLTPEVIDEISAIDGAAAITNPRIRVATVATAPAISAISAQFANSPLNPYLTHFFESMTEAMAWLALPAAPKTTGRP